MADRGEPIVIGIDSGTQSVKVLCVSAETGDVIASASAPHALIESLPPGHLEQHPADWFDAMNHAMVAALNSPGVDPSAVAAIGVSGQQHGFVPLDDRDEASAWGRKALDVAIQARRAKVKSPRRMTF